MIVYFVALLFDRVLHYSIINFKGIIIKGLGSRMLFDTNILLLHFPTTIFPCTLSRYVSYFRMVFSDFNGSKLDQSPQQWAMAHDAKTVIEYLYSVQDKKF